MPPSFLSRSSRNVALARGERFENWIEPLDGFLGAADHHAVSALESPYAAAGSHINVVNAFALQFIRPAHIIFEVGVAAVDDGVSRLHVAASFCTVASVGPPAGTMIQTARGGVSLAIRSSSEAEPVAPSPARLLYRVRAEVGNHELMSAAHQSPRHIRAHAAETYHS